MRPPRPSEAAISCTEVRKCFKQHLSILQSRPFCCLGYVFILGEKPVALSFAGAYSFFLRITASTETKNILFCEGQYYAKPLLPVMSCNIPSATGSLSPSTRTLTHRLAFYSSVSTKLGPIQPIVPNSRAPRAKKTLSTSSNSILVKPGSTSASVPSSYASRASQKRLRPYKLISAEWISTGLNIQSTPSSVSEVGSSFGLVLFYRGRVKISRVQCHEFSCPWSKQDLF